MNPKEKVTALIREAVARHELPCGTVLVLQHGQELLYAEAGRDLETGAPVRRDSIFRLYSQTKPITAAAVALLMERGVIDALDPVEKYLPGFAAQKVIGGDLYRTHLRIWRARQLRSVLRRDRDGTEREHRPLPGVLAVVQRGAEPGPPPAATAAVPAIPAVPPAAAAVSAVPAEPQLRAHLPHRRLRMLPVHRLVLLHPGPPRHVQPSVQHLRDRILLLQ